MKKIHHQYFSCRQEQGRASTVIYIMLRHVYFGTHNENDTIIAEEL